MQLEMDSRKRILSGLVWSIPPFLLMSLIWFLSSIPMDTASGLSGFVMSIEPGLQNLLHLPLFGLLACLWLSLLSRSGIPRWSAFVLSGLFATIYGCLDEYHQTFVAGRYGSLGDLLLDMGGALLGLLLMWTTEKRTLSFGDAMTRIFGWVPFIKW